MIKTTSGNTSLNAGFLESLRDLSENLSKEEVKELFGDSAEDLYNNNLFTSTKQLVDINKIKSESNNGIDLLYHAAKSHKQKGYDVNLLSKSFVPSMGFEMPEWFGSMESIKKAKKVTALKAFKAILKERYVDKKKAASLFANLFDFEDGSVNVNTFVYSIQACQSYNTLENHLRSKSNQVTGRLTIPDIIDSVTETNLLTNKEITVFYSTDDKKLSLVDRGSCITISTLSLELSNGTPNKLMASLIKPGADPVEVFHKIIASALKRKYLYLSKNKATFQGFLDGRFPFFMVPESDVKNYIQYRSVYDLKQYRDLVPDSDKEKYDHIVDILLGR